VKWILVGEGPGSSRVLLGQFDHGAALLTPVYVPSFSSFGDPDFLHRSLAVLGSVEKVLPQSRGFLFSAYDLAALIRRGGVGESQLVELLKVWPLWWLDNGVFEQTHFGAMDWGEADFEDVVRRVKPPLVVAFEFVAQKPSSESLKDSIDLGLRSAARVRGLAESVTLLMRPHPASSVAALVPTLDARQLFDEGAAFDVLGVPEANLGPTLDARLSAIRALRAALNKLNEPKALHIFGASDPTALAAYVLAGADVFDGLNWSRYWIDFESRALRDKSLWSPPPTSSYSVGNHEVHLAVHNMASMQVWMNGLRDLVMGKRGTSSLENALLDRMDGHGSGGL
jgi:hypothetical protein